MKIAILTIATGAYDIFIPDLVDSCENFFLPGIDKKYFVFTDSDKIKEENNLIRIHQRKLGWPFDTMMRFHMFNSIKDKLSDFDFVFFMNANLKIVARVDDSILDVDSTCGIIATLHPGYYRTEKFRYPLERNPRSVFYVPFGEEINYYQGCFNGGKTKQFLAMSSILSSMIDKDLANMIIPIWHDETALNWFLKNRSVKILDPSYSYPEPGQNGDPHDYLIGIYGDPKIIQKDKNNYGGKRLLRTKKN